MAVYPLRPAPHQEGRIAIVTTRGLRDAMDALLRMRRSASRRTAKPCGPGLPTLRSSSATRFAERRGLSSPVPRGERGISRSTIVQGMPDCFGVPVVTTRVLSTFVREAAGATNTRHSLRPPCFRGCDGCSKTRADHAAGMLAFGNSSLRGAERRSNPFLRLRRYGLLRFARNDENSIPNPISSSPLRTCLPKIPQAPRRERGVDRRAG